MEACSSTTVHVADGEAQALHWVPGDVAESGFVVLVVAPVRPRHLLQVQAPRHSLPKGPHSVNIPPVCVDTVGHALRLMHTASVRRRLGAFLRIPVFFPG